VQLVTVGISLAVPPLLSVRVAYTLAGHLHAYSAAEHVGQCSTISLVPTDAVVCVTSVVGEVQVAAAKSPW
jgi:hypothetical protein